MNGKGVKIKSDMIALERRVRVIEYKYSPAGKMINFLNLTGALSLYGNHWHNSILISQEENK